MKQQINSSEVTARKKQPVTKNGFMEKLANLNQKEGVFLKKSELLKLASNQEARPSSTSTQDYIRILGMALRSYTNPTQLAYDKDFHAKIKQLQPKWFHTKKTISQQKQELLDFVRKNKDLSPFDRTSEMDRMVTKFTKPRSKNFDPNLKQTIQEEAPSFLKSKSSVQKERLEQTKNEIRQLVVANKDRPSTGSNDASESELALKINRILKPSSATYDKELADFIFKKAPHWFSRNAKLKKKELVSWAMREEIKPDETSQDRREAQLAKALALYTRQGSKLFDYDFTMKIAKSAPDWVG